MINIRTLSKLLTIIFSSVFFTSCANQFEGFTESHKTELKIEVQHSFESLVKATEKLDWESYFAHFDQNNFSGLNADGTIWKSFSEFEKSVSPSFEMIEESQSLNFPILEINIIDKKTAILVNEYDQTILLTNGQSIEVSGGGTQVWSKLSGQWKLVSISASSK